MRVDDVWKQLVDLGVPDGTVRPATAVRADSGRTRELIATAVARPLSPREREVLFAWLRGWKHHWPRSFAQCLGEVGESALTALEAAGIDAGRYLKLRRIAIENLAQRL